MNAERWATAGITLALVAVGAVAWGLHLAPALEPRAEGLGALPRSIQGWKAQDVPLESTVENMLRADYNVQREYVHPTGSVLWLYVGYYGTGRGGRPEHTPWVCYPANGWKVESSRPLTVDEGLGLRVNELVVHQDGARRLVHFWYRSHRATGLLGAPSVFFDHAIGRIRSGRADGALVRISTPLAGADRAAARSRLISFAVVLDPILGELWPDEVRPGG